MPVAIVGITQVPEPLGSAGAHCQHSHRIRTRAPRHDVAAAMVHPVLEQRARAMAVEEGGAGGEPLIEFLAEAEHATDTCLRSGVTSSREHSDDATGLECRRVPESYSLAPLSLWFEHEITTQQSGESMSRISSPKPSIGCLRSGRSSPRDSSDAVYCARNTSYMLTKIVDNICALAYANGGKAGIGYLGAQGTEDRCFPRR